MEVDFDAQSITAAVGALASFQLSADFAPPAHGNWRAMLGTEWHTHMRQLAAAEDSAWQFEVPCSACLRVEGWQFSLSGRIDQFHQTAASTRLREVKTTRFPLPADPAELRQRFPAWFHQSALYARLLQDAALPAGEPPPRPVLAEVLAVDIDSGLNQCIALTAEDFTALDLHLRCVAAYWSERQRHRLDLRDMPIPPPFAQWRDGQPAARAALAAHADAPLLLFQAPTGFGKSGLMVERALRALHSGHCERALFLTARNTGHSPILNHLRSAWAAGAQARFLAIRSRADLNAIAQSQLLDTAPTALNAAWQRFTDSAIAPADLFPEGECTLDDLRHFANALNIHPRFLLRFILPHADVWVADFNYVFDPDVLGMLANCPGFTPQRSLLFVDEAHQLHDRAASALSFSIQLDALKAILSELQWARFPGKLTRLLDTARAACAKLAPTDAISPAAEADWIAHLEDILDAWDAASFETDALSDASVDWLFGLASKLAAWRDPRLRHLAHVPTKGHLRVDCADPAPHIRDCMLPFAATTLLSATLQPRDLLLAELGLEARPHTFVDGHAPWLETAFDVRVDARVSTAFQHRHKALHTTAHTVGRTALAAGRLIAVFFPSYAYANAVAERIRRDFPVLRIALQPRQLPSDGPALEAHWDFLNDALLSADILCMILGSRFTEGIDALGGRIHEAIVVSPAFPEPDALRKFRADTAPALAGISAFDRFYSVPAMRRIQQALGRLVRQPGHHARVLLHCQRFANPALLRHLPPYLQPSATIDSNEALDFLWLNCL